ncbi:MAG: CopG family transcriptional regulator [Candidatus Altiarchaeales archaeon]|nr:CopG family transcriptional regulator [Candidatus Altiarchaeales archaeon]
MTAVFQELDANQTIVSLPTPIYKKIAEKISGTDFKSVSEYVTFTHRTLLGEQGSSEEKNLEAVKKRLKKLGYL